MMTRSRQARPAQAFFGKNDLLAAGDYAQKGLEQAQALGMLQSIRAFTNDLARISARLRHSHS